VAQHQFGLYVLGILGAVGSLIGRIPCGWLCPFGFIQELFYKIPTPKLQIPKFLSYFRYVVLALMVILLPLLIVDEFGYGETWFCKWICPAGTLEAGIPLVALNAGIRSQIGFMFSWKMGILILFLAWMIFSQRPFCRTTCPLGAIFGLFNKASLFRMVVDDEKCIQCNKCYRNCPVKVKVHETPNSPDCIRCLKCIESCQYGAVNYEFLRKKPQPAPVEKSIAS
jgi:polyferredoxin